MKNTDGPVVVEQIFNTSQEVVWRAITEVGQMQQWFFKNIPEFKPEVGFETQFNVEIEDRNFLHLWRVTEVAPLEKIAYNWKYEGYPGDSFVMFELTERSNSTTLKLTHQVRESFPQNIPEFKRESGVQGWTFFIQKSLKEFLEKNA